MTATKSVLKKNSHIFPKQKNEFGHLNTYFTELSSEITELVHKVHSNRSQENVHDLRVCVRRMRAALWMVKHSPKALRFRKLETRLRDLGKYLGTVRELDVTIRESKKFRLKAIKLIDRRESARKKLHKSTCKYTARSLKKLSTSAAQTIKSQDKTSFHKAGEKLSSRIHSDTKKKQLGPVDLHHLRINFKKVRYLLESLGRSSEPLKPLISFLGKAHDLLLLREMNQKCKRAKNEENVLNSKARKLLPSAVNYVDMELQSIT